MRNARWRLVGAVVTAFAATMVVRPLLADDEPDAVRRSKTDRSYYYSGMRASDKAIEHLARASEVSLLPYGDQNLLYTKRAEVSSMHPVLGEFDRRTDRFSSPLFSATDAAADHRSRFRNGNRCLAERIG